MTGGRPWFLTTDRLQFSHWNQDDLPLAMSLWGDPRVSVYIGGPFSNQQVAARLQVQIAALRDHRIQYWPMFTRGEEQFVGCAGLRPYEGNADVLELGFHLLPAYWGQGLAQEGANAVIEYAFETLTVASIFAGHHPDNLASGRLLKKLGFHFTHEEFYPPTGFVEPCYLLPNPRLVETSSDRRDLTEGDEEGKP